MGYEAVLFDNDGVLLAVTDDDGARFRSALRAAFEAVGVDDPRDEHVEGLVYGVTPAYLREVAADYGVDPDRLWRARDRHCSRVQREQMRAGEKGLYDDAAVLSALDRPTGIVSTNQHATVEFVLDHFDLAAHVDTYYGREPTVESLRRKKPDPHYLDRALDDLGTREAVFVGDSPSDVEAAHNAGIDSAVVRREHVDWETPTPTHELGDLHGLRALV